MLTNPFAPDCFHAIDTEVLEQTLKEPQTQISHEIEMGGGIVVYYGIRHNRSLWLMRNPGGLCAAWFDDGSNTPDAH